MSTTASAGLTGRFREDERLTLEYQAHFRPMVVQLALAYPFVAEKLRLAVVGLETDQTDRPEGNLV